MKTLLLALTLTFSLSPVPSFASSGELLFAEGPEKGQSVLASYIGYYEMCFTGNPYAVRNKALQLMESDIEKDSVFARVNAKKDELVLSYVDTKCLEDSLDATPGSCRVSWTVPRCE